MDLNRKDAKVFIVYRRDAEGAEILGLGWVFKVVGWVRLPGHGNAMPLHLLGAPMTATGLWLVSFVRGCRGRCTSGH